MSLIASLHEWLHGASTTPNPSNETENDNKSITFTMSPPIDLGHTWSDVGNTVFVGDNLSSKSDCVPFDDSILEKTDFTRFARVTFRMLGPDGIPRESSYSKMGQIESMIRMAAIPSNLRKREQRLRELVVRFENRENREGWVWMRNEDLRKLNDYFQQSTYGVDGDTDELTENNARGSLEKCLDIFNEAVKAEKFVVELPSTIDLDDRLFRYITKGSRARINKKSRTPRGFDHTVIKSADGKVHLFKYENGELQVQRKELLPLDDNEKKPWKLYEIQKPNGNELGGR